MTCPRCLHENPADARFCNQCAQTLLQTSADREVPAAVLLEAERKLISVLFADVKGSMGLLAGLDPEEARNILDPVLELMMEAVRHYGGTVNQVMGDGIMALFGAPVAFEQHAARACFAALRMQASVKRHNELVCLSAERAVQVRVGINSGEVVVRSIHGDLHMDYTAIGVSTHLAARMEQLARPGSVFVTAETLRLAKGSVQARPIGSVQVAGLRETVNAFELVGPGPARGLQVAAGGFGPGRLVGRDSEMRALGDASELVKWGHGQMVTVVGDAGIGKSRLLHEFVNGADLAGWLVFDTACVSYGKTKGYLPMIDALKPYFGIVANDDPRAVRDRVASKLLALDASLERSLPALWALFDVTPPESSLLKLDLGQRRKATTDAIRWIVIRECRVQRVALVVEDLQWIDAESSAVLEALIECLPDTELLLLTSLRPGTDQSRHRVPRCRELHLGPLPRASIEELLDSLMGKASELHDLRQPLIARTEGNPFFIEECVAALAEAGVLSGRRGAFRRMAGAPLPKVPTTVQSLLAARIDRLGTEPKHLLQAAAVLGEGVSLTLLQSVAGLPQDVLAAALARLQATDLLRATTRHAEPSYTFKHALIHEVSYSSMLGPRRRELHASAVAAIEGVCADSIDAHVAQLAHHSLRAGLNDKAFRYLLDAGQKALGRSAQLEAVSLFEEALNLVPGLPESPETLTNTLRIHQGLGYALRATKGDWANDVEVCYTQALQLCDRVGESADRFPLVLGLWAHHYSRGNYGQAQQLAVDLGHLAVNGDDARSIGARHSQWATAVAAGSPASVLPSLKGDQAPSQARQEKSVNWDLSVSGWRFHLDSEAMA